MSYRKSNLHSTIIMIFFFFFFLEMILLWHTMDTISDQITSARLWEGWIPSILTDYFPEFDLIFCKILATVPISTYLLM